MLPHRHNYIAYNRPEQIVGFKQAKKLERCFCIWSQVPVISNSKYTLYFAFFKVHSSYLTWSWSSAARLHDGLGCLFPPVAFGRE